MKHLHKIKAREDNEVTKSLSDVVMLQVYNHTT